MPYDNCVAGDLRRSAEGRLTFPLTCGSDSDPSLRPVTREYSVTGATKPYEDWVRGLAISLVAELNIGVEFEHDVAKILGQPLDIVTPLPDTTPQEDKVVVEFTILWNRERSLVASVKAEAAKQSELDDAILARKTFYSNADDAIKPRLDAVMRLPF